MNPMSATVRAIFYTLALICFALALHPRAARVNLVALGLFFWVLTLAWDSWALS